MKKLKPKKENNDVNLSIACKHLLTSIKPVKIYEIVFSKSEEESTFMCPKCYRDEKMLKDMEDGLIDDWVTVCNHCIHSTFKKVETEYVNEK